MNTQSPTEAAPAAPVLRPVDTPAKIPPRRSWQVIVVRLVVCMFLFGILAGMLSPLVGYKMTSIAVEKIANNGRAIIYSIIEENTAREATTLGDIWPDAREGHGEGFSETYFADLIALRKIENIPWAMFVGAGVPGARDEAQFRNGGHNVWSYICYPPYRYVPDDSPFMFTHNLRLTNDDLVKRDFGSLKLDKSVKPLGASGVVIIRRDGEVRYIKESKLRMSLASASVKPREPAPINVNFLPIFLVLSKFYFIELSLISLHFMFSSLTAFSE